VKLSRGKKKKKSFFLFAFSRLVSLVVVVFLTRSDNNVVHSCRSGVVQLLFYGIPGEDKKILSIGDDERDLPTFGRSEAFFFSFVRYARLVPVSFFIVFKIDLIQYNSI